ncbi:MAG: site-specific DNA-methyltransferase [Phormidesmis sp. CAN_BIN36]|nr:site-specific DNA-methyltransferase [Phormidesmis sp. CAN_BIN36]
MQYIQPLIPHLKLESNNSELNHLRTEDKTAHRWYRFILSFPPHLVQDYLEKFGVNESHQVLDPFCGTGTTVVECKKLGIPSVGVEANPMAWFAGTVKLDWSLDPDELLRHADQIAKATEESLDRTEEPLQKLPDDRFNLLLKNSISPLPLHKSLVLLEQIKQHADSPYLRHELLALAKALVFSISNLHFGPEVGVGKAKTDAQVVDSWLEGIEAIAADLRYLKTLPDTSAIVHHADSRQLANVLKPNSIDAVITSPPYPNEKDYTRTTRLESVILGFINSKAELQTLKKGLMRSNSRSVYKADDDDRWVADHVEIQRIANAIEAKRIELGKTSGFERMYARATRLYFGGMARHLADLRQVLRPGAQLAYVVGDQASYLRVMIRTGTLLADIAKSLGYEVVSIDLFRTRLATVTQEQLREEVVVLRWLGR